MKKVLLLLGVLGALALVSVPAMAGTALDPGTVATYDFPGVSAGTAGYYSLTPPALYNAITAPNGLDLVVEKTYGFTSSAGLTGSLTSWVYKANETGVLTFEYQFTVTSYATGKEVSSATIGSSGNPWLGVGITDVGADGSGVSKAAGSTPQWANGDPYEVSRDSTTNGAGIDIYWRENATNGTQLQATETDSTVTPSNSAIIWITTDQLYYQLVDVSVQDSGSNASTFGFAPAVPEPVSAIFFVTGVIGVFGFVTRKRMLRGVKSEK